MSAYLANLQYIYCRSICYLGSMSRAGSEIKIEFVCPPPLIADYVLSSIYFLLSTVIYLVSMPGAGE